jgi:hypothetical protein
MCASSELMSAKRGDCAALARALQAAQAEADLARVAPRRARSSFFHVAFAAADSSVAIVVPLVALVLDGAAYGGTRQERRAPELARRHR